MRKKTATTDTLKSLWRAQGVLTDAYAGLLYDGRDNAAMLILRTIYRIQALVLDLIEQA